MLLQHGKLLHETSTFEVRKAYTETLCIQVQVKLIVVSDPHKTDVPMSLYLPSTSCLAKQLGREFCRMLQYYTIMCKRNMTAYCK